MKRLMTFAAIIGMAILFTAATATAGPKPTEKATGSILMEEPLQYISFNAFDFGETDDRGQVSYTNWESEMEGTGIFNLEAWDEMDVVSATIYEHTLTVTSFVPTSPFSADFTATGANHTNPGTWTMWGTVEGDAITFTVDVDGSDYLMWAEGAIASDGSMSGTATHTANDSVFTWSAPAGSAFEVRHFDSEVTCAVVDSEFGTASFGWQAGTDGYVVSVVSDDGSPGAGNDTYDHGFGGAASCSPDGLYGPYPIIGGNLTVH